MIRMISILALSALSAAALDKYAPVGFMRGGQLVATFERMPEHFENTRHVCNMSEAELTAAGWVNIEAVVTNIIPAQVVTSTAPASVIAKAQQLGRILTNFASITSQTGVNYNALKEYALNNAADLTIAQQTMLATCDRLWAEVREYAPNGLLNFSPTTVTTNPARAEVEWTPK